MKETNEDNDVEVFVPPETDEDTNNGDIFFVPPPPPPPPPHDDDNNNNPDIVNDSSSKNYDDDDLKDKDRIVEVFVPPPVPPPLENSSSQGATARRGSFGLLPKTLATNQAGGRVGVEEEEESNYVVAMTLEDPEEGRGDDSNNQRIVQVFVPPPPPPHDDVDNNNNPDIVNDSSSKNYDDDLKDKDRIVEVFSVDSSDDGYVTIDGYRYKVTHGNEFKNDDDAEEVENENDVTEVVSSNDDDEEDPPVLEEAEKGGGSSSHNEGVVINHNHNGSSTSYDDSRNGLLHTYCCCLANLPTTPGEILARFRTIAMVIICLVWVVAFLCETIFGSPGRWFVWCSVIAAILVTSIWYFRFHQRHNDQTTSNNNSNNNAMKSLAGYILRTMAAVGNSLVVAAFHVEFMYDFFYMEYWAVWLIATLILCFIFNMNLNTAFLPNPGTGYTYMSNINAATRTDEQLNRGGLRCMVIFLSLLVWVVALSLSLRDNSAELGFFVLWVALLVLSGMYLYLDICRCEQNEEKHFKIIPPFTIQSNCLGWAALFMIMLYPAIYKRETSYIYPERLWIIWTIGTMILLISIFWNLKILQHASIQIANLPQAHTPPWGGRVSI